MYSCVDPICMYPTKIPKDDKLFHPVLLGTATKSKVSAYGVDYYHFFSALLQEISFDVDDQFLITLMEFFKLEIEESDWEDAQGFVLYFLCPENHSTQRSSFQLSNLVRRT
jgi:vacuolar protein sorting-associated protein 13A/C